MATKDDVAYVLEVNRCVSWTVTYLSKATGVPLCRGTGALSGWLRVCRDGNVSYRRRRMGGATTHGDEDGTV